MSDLVTAFIDSLILLAKKNGGNISTKELLYLKEYSQNHGTKNLKQEGSK